MAFKFKLDFEEQVAKWSMTMEDAGALGMTELSAAQSDALGLGNRPAIRIPYYDYSGAPTGFFRVRYLGGEGPRYMQLKESDTHAYFPPTVKWQELPDDATIVVVEGEAKAARGAKDGHACIGLGGVWNFKCKRTGEFEILDELRAVKWEGRKVLIVFDSDVIRKPQVLGALHALAYALSCLGGKPETVILPEGPNGEKQGLDDYLGRGGKLDDPKLKIETFAQLRVLWKMNEEFAISLEPIGILDLESRKIQSKDQFTGVTVANRMSQIINAKGEPSIAPAGPAWVAWPYRRQYKRLDYIPGMPTNLPGNTFNMFPGFWAEPKEDDKAIKKHWEPLMRHVFGADLQARDYFERWVAYPLAHAPAKLMQAVIFKGKTGTGKSLISYMIAAVYGAIPQPRRDENNVVDLSVPHPSRYNTIEIGQEQLHGRFNNWIQNKAFVIATEVSATDRRKDVDKLKALITAPTVSVELKCLHAYTQRNFCQFMFNSNWEDALSVDDDDRRYFVWDVGDKKYDPDSGEAAMRWAETPDGAGALMYYFQTYESTHENISGYKPNGDARRTAARDAMINAGRSNLESFALRVMSDAKEEAGASKSSPVNLVRIDKLVKEYMDTGGVEKANAKGMINALKKLGAKQVVELRGLRRERYNIFSLAQHEYWAKEATYEAGRKRIWEIVTTPWEKGLSLRATPVTPENIGDVLAAEAEACARAEKVY